LNLNLNLNLNLKLNLKNKIFKVVRLNRVRCTAIGTGTESNTNWAGSYALVSFGVGFGGH
jgi:hypothetical protein